MLAPASKIVRAKLSKHAFKKALKEWVTRFIVDPP